MNERINRKKRPGVSFPHIILCFFFFTATTIFNYWFFKTAIIPSSFNHLTSTIRLVTLLAHSVLGLYLCLFM